MTMSFLILPSVYSTTKDFSIIVFTLQQLLDSMRLSTGYSQLSGIQACAIEDLADSVAFVMNEQSIEMTVLEKLAATLEPYSC
jgi:hypothetical protein